MNATPLLHTLFLKNTLGRPTPLSRIAEACLHGIPFEKDLVEQVLPTVSETDDAPSHTKCIRRWREFFALVVVLHLSQDIPSYKERLTAALRNLRQIYPYRELQLAVAYEALSSFFLGLPCKIPPCETFESGASPIEKGGYGIVSEVPNTLLQAELGIVWVLYGRLTKNVAFLEAAAKVAQWQMNTLDHHSIPFAGLFSTEGESCIPALAVLNALLFDGVAQSGGENEFAAAAKKQYEIAGAFASIERTAIPPHVMAISMLLHCENVDQVVEEHPLPEVMLDESLAMAGARSQSFSGVVTLYGCRTGMGCYHGDAVRVLSYGPQHLPLGDCTRYGLEGSARVLGSEVNTPMAGDRQCSVSGIARISSPSLSGKESGIWLNTKQKMDQGGFSIEGSFSQVYDPMPLAFSFFVQCEVCVVGKDRGVRRRSFDKYQGKLETITLQCGEEKFELTLEGDCAEMHVVPLGGGSNFWGADYLIAYLPGRDGEKFRYQLRRS